VAYNGKFRAIAVPILKGASFAVPPKGALPLSQRNQTTPREGDYVEPSLRETGLTPQAIKVARRLQGLPSDRTYGIIFVKEQGDWRLIVSYSAKTELITE